MSETSQGSAKRLHLRLFLEGMEVPVIAAQTQVNLNAPATASIQVVPTDRLLELKPRTMVHLFFYDFTKTYNEESDDPKDLKDYLLLYGGEIVGVQYTKTPVGRQAVIQCADWSSYWDTTYQLFLDYGAKGNVLTEKASLWGGGNNMFDNIIRGHESELALFLTQSPRTPGLTGVKGLLGGVINTLERMGGVPNHTKGVNDFFAASELRVKLLQQLAAEETDNTPIRIFRVEEFMNWITKGVTSAGRMVTFRTMLKLILRYIYYDVVPNPVAPYIPGSFEEGGSGEVAVKTSERVPFIRADAREMLETLATEAAEWESKFATYRNASSSKNLIDSKAALRDFFHRLKHIRSVFNSGQRPGLPPNGRSLPRVTVTGITRARSTISSFRSDMESFTFGSASPGTRGIGFVAPMTARKLYVISHRNWRAIKDAINSGLVVTRTELKRGKLADKHSLARLPTQIMRPDCFFVPPPKCNVLFPEQYTQFNYRRAFLQETTRLLMQVGMQSIGNDKLLSDYFLAPNMVAVRKVAKDQGTSGYRVLLPWEKYTGILPKYEYISDLMFYSSQKQRQLDKQQTTTTASTGNGAGGRVGGRHAAYAQRVANFNYIKHRFANRTTQVSMRFNPYMVAGFPAVVLDRPFHITEEAIREKLTADGVSADTRIVLNNLLELKKDTFSGLADAYSADPQFGRVLGAPTHYMGMVVSLSHSVSQSGGTTSATLTHSRIHRATDSDFLESFVKSKTKEIEDGITHSMTLVAFDVLTEGDQAKVDLLRGVTPQVFIDSPLKVDKYGARARPRKRINEKGFGLLADRDIEDGQNWHLNDTESVHSDHYFPNVSAKDTASRYRNSRSSFDERSGFATDIQAFPNITGPTSRVQKGKKVIDIPGAPTSLKKGSKTKFGTVASIRVINDLIKVDIRKNKDAFYWQKVVVSFTGGTRRKIVLADLPIEEVVRPPWFSPLYSNLHIGKHIYQRFFGTDSIVDDAILTPTALPEEELEVERSDFIDLTVEDVPKLSKIPHMEASIDLLAFLYGEVRRQGLDVQQFITDYTHRPIATMEDIFGSSDLKLSRAGESSNLTVDSGTLGFHSAAIVPPPLNEKLIGLLNDPATGLPRFSGKGKTGPISPAIDPRSGRREKVEEYVDELASADNLGTGLIG